MSNKNKLVATIDGNEAAAYVAYRINEVCAIIPSLRPPLWQNWQMSGHQKE